MNQLAIQSQLQHIRRDVVAMAHNAERAR
jgi:hypothetical protein